MLERLGWSGDDYPDQPARFVDVPVLRETPPDLLRRLRELDARAECVYLGTGRWWVGRVKPNSPRRADGRQLALRVMEGDGFGGNRMAERRQGLLMAQGFGLCVDVTVFGIPDGRLVRGFERFLAAERGHEVVDERQALYDKVMRDMEGEIKNRDRELTKWLWKRGGRERTNAWVGAGSNQQTGRLL